MLHLNGRSKNKECFASRVSRGVFGVIGLLCFLPSGPVIAGPEGAEVVGGSGSISRSGTTTTVNQATDRMAINWQSYDVNTNERVTTKEGTSHTAGDTVVIGRGV